ncbi:hypothetical protein F4776DRAFT_668001 [Hypoxylon sp. NC0597]|nr:hypothetical protein F4776DRAFT_668001 [Hypoxylon sp. NC0597]
MAANMTVPEPTTSIQDTSKTPKKRRAFQMPIVLYENDEFADVQLTCGGKQWKLHKIVVCKRSAWFKKALTGNFVEASGIIDIKEWSPDLIDRLITYIYEGEYIVPGSYDFVSPIKLWQLGDYFLVSGMCDSALEQLRKNLKNAKLELLRISRIENQAKNQETEPAGSVQNKGVGAATAYLSNQCTLMEILTNFRAGLSYVYAEKTIANPASSTAPVTSMIVFGEDHPVRLDLAAFYVKVGFRYYTDPRWELGSYIDKEVPRFAADVLRNLSSADINTQLLGLRSTCTVCRSHLDIRPRNVEHKPPLFTQAPRNDFYQMSGSGNSVVLIRSGWITGSEALCSGCTSKWW